MAADLMSGQCGVLPRIPIRHIIRDKEEGTLHPPSVEGRYRDRQMRIESVIKREGYGPGLIPWPIGDPVCGKRASRKRYQQQGNKYASPYSLQRGYLPTYLNDHVLLK